MMTQKEIEQRIQEILDDKRMHYKTANIVVNAPLAMVQLTLETELHTLQDVLGTERTYIKDLRGEVQ
jgi:hypothetical protein